MRVNPQPTQRGMMSRRYKDKPYKRLYSTKRWKLLRVEAFVRDGYKCQHKACGVLCVGKSPAGNSPVCDHIVKHEGDKTLFFDLNNLQTLCKRCHDGFKRRLEAGTRMQRTDGW